MRAPAQKDRDQLDQAQKERDDRQNQLDQAQKDRDQLDQARKERDDYQQSIMEGNRQNLDDYLKSIQDGIDRVWQQRDDLLNRGQDAQPEAPVAGPVAVPQDGTWVQTIKNRSQVTTITRDRQGNIISQS